VAGLLPPAGGTPPVGSRIGMVQFLSFSETGRLPGAASEPQFCWGNHCGWRLLSAPLLSARQRGAGGARSSHRLAPIGR